jgi:D-glycero-alpha-D-manno-heptose 1-phosphate guanylyltransferase
MRLLVLAGGAGSRLRSVLPDTPKALAPIDEVPFLALQIENWVNQGVVSFVFLLHHQADQVVKFLESVRHSLLKGCEVSVLIEPSPLDTGGAVAYAVRELGIQGDFFLTNADTWLGCGISKFTGSIAPAVAVVHLENTSRYGGVRFDEQRTVTEFIEKNISGVPGWINAGLCLLHSALFDRWDGQRFSLEHHFFPQLVQKRLLKAAPIKSDFIDIGVPADYQRFCTWVMNDCQGNLCN